MPALAGRTAVVTGASRGIGHAIALELARAGARLYLVADEPVAAIDHAAQDCRAAGAEACDVLRIDLGSPDAARTMIAQAHARLGRIDILVNNAGIRMRKPFDQCSVADFDRIVAVNLRAPFLASQAVVPYMRDAGGGRIIHIASQMGIVTHPQIALYSLTKAGLIHLTKSMALELAQHNIQVNAVSPGPATTEANLRRMHDDPGVHAERMKYMATDRLVTCEEVAAVVLFLATTDATAIQGHNLVVDGGYTLH